MNKKVKNLDILYTLPKNNKKSQYYYLCLILA